MIAGLRRNWVSLPAPTLRWWATVPRRRLRVGGAQELLPTVFQNVCTVDEVEKAFREDMKQLASSLTWDIRNAAAQEGQLDSVLAQRLDPLKQKLLAEHCRQD
jgi:soluble cytochrome b562